MVQINRFKVVDGTQVLDIHGQSRLGYNHSDGIEFYEVEDVIQHNGFYKGNNIIFFDYDTGEVYCPFELKQNVVYSQVTYINRLYYFIQCDFSKRKVNAIEYYPGRQPKIYHSLNMDDVELYNLMIMDNDLKIVSDGKDFICYYPQSFIIPLESRESVISIDDEKVYINQWVEEGDDDDTCLTNDYHYYEKLIIKDLSGNTLSEEIGYLSSYLDDELWLS